MDFTEAIKMGLGVMVGLFLFWFVMVALSMMFGSRASAMTDYMVAVNPGLSTRFRTERTDTGGETKDRMSKLSYFTGDGQHERPVYWPGGSYERISEDQSRIALATTLLLRLNGNAYSGDAAQQAALKRADVAAAVELGLVQSPDGTWRMAGNEYFSSALSTDEKLLLASQGESVAF